MSLSGIMDCYAKPVAVYDYNTLKDDPLIDPTTIGLKGSPTNIFKSFTPPQKGVGIMLEGADKATCELSLIHIWRGRRRAGDGP